MTKRVIVVHTAESGETPGAAEGVTNYLEHRGLPVTRVFDADSETQMLDIRADCSGARGLPKADGVHYEHAGRAEQSAADWSDPYSTQMLDRSARRAAEDATELKIPVVRLTPQQVKAGASGFCGHIDVTNAYQIRGGHWDPGPGFPWDRYLDLVRKYQGETTAPVPPAASEEDVTTVLLDHKGGAWLVFSSGFRSAINDHGTHDENAAELAYWRFLCSTIDYTQNPKLSAYWLNATKAL